MDEEQGQARCRECRNLIERSAKLCPTCKSYQDWRRFFPISSTVLAIVTALVSVLTVSVPVFYRWYHIPESHAYFTNPSIEGTTLRLVAVNTGDAPATFISARVDGNYLAGATKVRLRNDSDAMIPPGTKLVTFDIIPLLDEDESYSGSLAMIAAEIGQGEKPKQSILVGIAESNGDTLVQRVPLSVDDLFGLLRGNADRCSAITEPNFENGCIGSGVPPEQMLPRPSGKSSPQSTPNQNRPPRRDHVS